MDLSNLHMTMKAYQKVSRSILSNYVTHPELDNAIDSTLHLVDIKLEGYVEELPPETEGNGKVYGRQYKRWVEIDPSYKKPEILVFELVGLKEHYEYGETVTVTGITHQESNIAHISYLKLYRDGEFIAEVDPSQDTKTDSISDSFIIEGTATYKFEMESDIGNVYYQTIEVVAEKVSYMYTGMSVNATLTNEEIVRLPLKDIVEGEKYKYQMGTPSYVYWCATEKIDTIKQDGLYSIDLVEFETDIDGVHFYGYRTLDLLAVNTWRFTLVLEHPEPPAEIRDLRLGGAITEDITSEGILDLTAKDFEEERIYTVNLSTNAYIWVCCPYEISIMDASGAYPDFELIETGVEADGYSFNCYRSTDVLYAGKWQFKFEKD